MFDMQQCKIVCHVHISVSILYSWKYLRELNFVACGSLLKCTKLINSQRVILAAVGGCIDTLHGKIKFGMHKDLIIISPTGILSNMVGQIT